MQQSDVRIGRDQTNDIWIDSPAVRPQTCLVYFRDGEHNLKVFEGAKVGLNGQIVRGLHRLYSGDRIAVGDRELLFARDDSPPQVAVGLTVLLDGEVRYGMVYRRTRVLLGRAGADLVLDDASVADRHLTIECYSERGLFAFDLGTRGGSAINGKPFEQRRRLRDGDMVQVGRVTLRVHLLPLDAHGLLLAEPLPERPLVPLAAPMPMDRSPTQRHDPSAASTRSRQGDGRPVTSGFIRPGHSPNAAASVPVPIGERPPAQAPVPAPAPADAGDLATRVGSLQQLLRDAQRATPGQLFGEPQHTVLADAVRLQLGDIAPVRPAAPRSAPESAEAVPSDAIRDLPPPLPDAGNVPVERPAVRINVDGGQRRGERAPPPAWHDESSMRENLRVRPREAVDEERMVAVSGSSGRGFHEQRTEMLDTVGDDGADWQRDPVLRRAFADTLPRGEGPSSTAVLDTNLPPPLPPKTRSQRDDRRPGWQEGRGSAPPPAHVQGQRGGEERYRVGRLTGGWEGPQQDADPAPDRYQDPDRYRLQRGPAQDRRNLHDDRPRVQSRELTAAERAANPDFGGETDPPRQGDAATCGRDRDR